MRAEPRGCAHGIVASNTLCAMVHCCSNIAAAPRGGVVDEKPSPMKLRRVRMKSAEIIVNIIVICFLILQYRKYYCHIGIDIDIVIIVKILVIYFLISEL